MCDSAARIKAVKGYYILSCARVPGVLIETAFLSNAKEKELLKTEAFTDTIAASIAEGADLFLKSESEVCGALTQ